MVGKGKSDRYEHVSYKEAPGVASKVGNSLCQLCIAPVVIFLGCALLWYNEGVAIKTHRSLNEALDAYVNIPDALYVPSEHNSKLVHLSHKLSVDSPAMDDAFGLTRDAVAINRKVEIFQWVEQHEKKERKLQNGETEVRDVYTYNKQWSDSPVSSSGFHHPEHHDNFGEMPYTSETFQASGVKLGAYSLASALTSQLTDFSTVPLRGNVRLPSGADLRGNTVYFSSSGGGHGGRAEIGHRRNEQVDYRSDDRRDSHDAYQRRDLSEAIDKKIMTIDGEDKIMYTVKATGETFSDRQKALQAAASTVSRQLLDVGGGTQIGDVRVTFTEVKCTTVSVLGKQAGETLTSWPSAQGSGYDVALLSTGQVSAEDMISSAQSTNTIMTWVKRAVGWLLNLIGIGMITQIVTTTADITLNWIPFLGPMATSIINLGVSIANFILSLTLSVIVAAIAWVFYRPVLGISMLFGACGLFYVSSQAGNHKMPKVRPARKC